MNVVVIVHRQHELLEVVPAPEFSRSDFLRIELLVVACSRPGRGDRRIGLRKCRRQQKDPDGRDQRKSPRHCEDCAACVRAFQTFLSSGRQRLDDHGEGCCVRPLLRAPVRRELHPPVEEPRTGPTSSISQKDLWRLAAARHCRQGQGCRNRASRRKENTTNRRRCCRACEQQASGSWRL